jgi:probable blue pigment (indigoidine) exporter
LRLANIDIGQYIGQHDACDLAAALVAEPVFASHPLPRAILALTLAAASWGLGTVVAKRAVTEIAPLTLLAIQLGASLTILAVLMRSRGVSFRDSAASPILGRLGVLNPGLAYALSLLGLVHISASLSVLLWAMEPLLILLLAGWLLRERVGVSVVILSVAAVGGMTLVIDQPGSTGTALGVGLTLAGVVCCAIYTIVTRRWIGTSDSTVQVVFTQQAHALGFAMVVVVALMVAGGAVLPDKVSLAGWASAAGSGVLYYGLAYWFYLSGLRYMPASLAAATFYLIPVFGVAGGVLLLGERLALEQWVGVAVVAGSVLLILRQTISAPHVPAARSVRSEAS